MKNHFLAAIFFVFTALTSTTGNAQEFPKLDKSPMDVAAFPSSYKESNKIVKIIYSRPQLKGRKVADLAPVGKVWRTGANEAVEIIFYKDVTFGGKRINAGTYSLFTIPGEKEWTIIISAANNVWGAYFYNESEDIVRVKGKVSKSNDLIEAFSMTFDSEMNLHMGWGHTIISVPIKD